MSEVNVPLLRKAVEWAESEAAKPREVSQWHQTRFAEPIDCGTAYCLAGWVAVNDGLPQSVFAEYMAKSDASGEAAITIEDRAAAVLGLTDEQANRLFDADNTIEDVREIAESMAGERL